MRQPTTQAPPRRLNLGCGFDHRPGYLNVDFQDFHQPDLKADVRDLSMLATDGYEEAIAFDVLEHLERDQVVPTLREWNRVLEPGGSLHVRTTDVLGLAELMWQRDCVADHHTLIQSLFGTQAYAGDYHLCGFTDVTLSDHLFEAGFDRIRISRHHGWLLEVDARKRPAEPDAEDLVALGLDQGFFARESAGGNEWNWCRSIAGILLFSRLAEPARARVDLVGSRPDRGVPVELHGPGASTRATIGADPSLLALELMLQPGPNRLSLVCHGPPFRPVDDERSLHLRVHEIAFALST